MERQFSQKSRGNLTTRLLGASLDTMFYASSHAKHTAGHWDSKDEEVMLHTLGELAS